MMKTRYAEKAFEFWKELPGREAEAFAMAYLMGQGDALRQFDGVLETTARIEDARAAIAAILQDIATDVRRGFLPAEQEAQQAETPSGDRREGE